MSKYHAVKTSFNGIVFDSKKEAHRYYELSILQAAGEISDLQRQVTYELIPKQDGERPCTYKADFVYRENGKTVVEDVKGVRTDAYKIKRKLMLWVHGIKIREI